MTHNKRPFERFLLRAWLIAAAAVAVSLALIAFGVSLDEGFIKTLLITVATATLAIGGITFLYEAYLRRTLTQDVLDLVQLEERIAQAGFQDVSKRNAVDWRKFFAAAEHIRLLPIDPVSWLADEWVHAIDANLHAGPVVEIYLPNPAAETLPLIAARLGREDGSFGADVQRVLRRVESDCKTLHSRYTSGRFTIYTYDGTPGYGLALADHHLIVSIPGLLGFLDPGQFLSFRFDEGEDDLVESWIRAQLESIPSTGTHFTT